MSSEVSGICNEEKRTVCCTRLMPDDIWGSNGWKDKKEEDNRRKQTERKQK